MKSVLKRMAGETWRRRARRLSRLRWLTKAGIIRAAGLPLRGHLRFILLDPEVESYTYRVANVAGMLAAIGEATSTSITTLSGYVTEAECDPALTGDLARHTRWRFDVKHHPHLGNRLAWYVLIRALRPPLVVETGIYHGLGSLVLLRAIERNRSEGSPGDLISFDDDPDAGDLVDRTRFPRWERVTARTDRAIAEVLAGREVGALFQDTAHTDHNQTIEFGAALDNASSRLLLVDGSGGESPTLARLAGERHGLRWSVELGAIDHWYDRQRLAFALFEQAALSLCPKSPSG